MSTKILRLNEEDKDSVIKLLAIHFMQLGFGYAQAKAVVQKKLNYCITSNHYNNYMTTIVRCAFRHLEDILATRYDNPIKPITHNEEKIIRSPMIQCRKWMSQDLLSTFLKLINLTHKCTPSSPDITFNQANTLYSQLLELINKAPEKGTILRDKKRIKQCKELEESMNKTLAKCSRNLVDEIIPNEQNQRQNVDEQRQKVQQKCLCSLRPIDYPKSQYQSLPWYRKEQLQKIEENDH